MNPANEPAPKHLPTREGYDLWSELYDSDGNPLIALEQRVSDGLIGEVRGLEAADIACGTGRHALRMAERGARVTAMDFSAGMLGVARGKPGALRVTWIEHDLHKPLPLASDRFDRVVCALAFDHVRDCAGVMRELGRICKPGPEGFVVVTVMHPAMMLRGVQARFIDPASGQRVMPASVANQISDYAMGAVSAGLRIEHMSEHSVDEELVREAPRAEKHMGWPLLLAMKLVKPRVSS
jgi:malonyl-CoA O-methyltransferase